MVLIFGIFTMAFGFGILTLSNEITHSLDAIRDELEKITKELKKDGEQ